MKHTYADTMPRLKKNRSTTYVLVSTCSLFLLPTSRQSLWVSIRRWVCVSFRYIPDLSCSLNLALIPVQFSPLIVVVLIFSFWISIFSLMNHLKFFTSICCSLFVDRLWRVRIIIAIAFYVHTENHLQESDSRPEPVFPPKFVLRSAWISFRVSLAQFFNFLGLIWYEIWKKSNKEKNCSVGQLLTSGKQWGLVWR